MDLINTGMLERIKMAEIASQFCPATGVMQKNKDVEGNILCCVFCVCVCLCYVMCVVRVCMCVE